MVTSKEFRMMLGQVETFNKNMLGEDLDINTCKEYFAQIRRLKSTKHKNTLLRIWNGDCLSNSRLIHLGIKDTNICPKCGELDTPKHLLINCRHAKRVWEMLMQKIPQRAACSAMQYAIGINDTRSKLMVKAEVLKYLMHFRELDPEEIINKSLSYLKAVNNRDTELINL